MMANLETVGWVVWLLCFFLLFYIYAGYLLILLGISWLQDRWGKENLLATPDKVLSVSVIVAAHNEVGRIRDRIKNILDMDYPQEALEV
ncbi:MAG: hypothetical protein ACE5GN_07135, partial [Waddliaceae bacterium]